MKKFWGALASVPFLLLAGNGCSASDGAFSETGVGTSPGPAGAQAEMETLHAQRLEALLKELPTTGDAEFLAVRADLEADLAALRSSHAEQHEAGLGSAQQALTNSDGCTTPWLADALLTVTLLTPRSTFSSQCAWHDHCYSSGKGTYGFDRAKCDSSWLQKMESRCNSKYPWYVKATGAGFALWSACNTTATIMYTAVRAAASDYFMSRPCIGGQIWPSTGWNGTCSTYEYFDTAAPLCTGASGERSDGTVGPNWNGCRGTGCAACSDALVGYPNYFKNNPKCKKNDTCAGSFYQCGSACPAPDAWDR